MVDVHCHLLPEVDDGPPTWEVAEQMCRMAAADGIEHIVATPHASERYAYDRARGEEGLERLRQMGIAGLTFSLGCDFQFSYENVRALLDRPAGYVISGTDYLLIELSNFAIPPGVDDAVARLREDGIIPVVTHPERNLLLQQWPQRALRFIQQGCVLQLTANSLTGFWGERAREMALWLLDRDAAHIIASDAHDLERRPPVLSAAREWTAKHYGQDLARALLEENPRALVLNQNLPFLPRPASK